MTPEEYRQERKARGTQAAVAAMLGVTRETVARRETGDYVVGKEAELAIRSLAMVEALTAAEDMLLRDYPASTPLLKQIRKAKSP